MMKVIDNFLPQYQFNQLQSLILGYEFDWYFNNGVSTEDDGSYQFIHLFYNNRPRLAPTPTIVWLDPYLPFFNMKKIYMIKANLSPRTVFHRKADYHVDNCQCSTTAIFYVNTCNGWTEFKKGGKVKSVANRVVIFDPTLEHRGVTCTDEKRRVVINFNYDV